MEPKQEPKVKFGEAVKITLRGYKEWWNIDTHIIIAPVCCAVVDGLSPFVGIYLSARIINELAGTHAAHTLVTLVLTALISAIVLTFLSAVLQCWKNCQQIHFWFTRKKFTLDKLLSMDFVKIEDPNTAIELKEIEDNEDYTGWGLKKLPRALEPIIKAIITIGAAAGLTVSMFTLRVPEESSLAIFNNPLFLAAIVIALLGITFLAPLFANKVGSYWSYYGETETIGNRLRWFYGQGLSQHRFRQLDVRIYRQDELADVVLSKPGAYSPGTLISKWAKGPMGLLNAASGAVSQVFVGAAYLFVCVKALGGAFGIGSVTQYVASITALSGGIAALMTELGGLGNNATFLQKLFEFHDIPNEMYQGSLTIEKRSDKKYDIEFCDVSFKYPGSEDYALQHVSLKFTVGQRLAVVGINGSGKTTFIKLLCRLYDPTEGEILLNGINIRKYDYKEYMSIFSVVFQDFQLLSEPLGQNVAAKMFYDEKKAKACLEGAGFGERLLEWPKGLETYLYKHLDEYGVDISGGEAQKIALARALYKDAAFIILDEPTAALDPIAEFEVYSRMNEIVGGKTAVFISHRLSSCRFCENIAVFHEGKIVQRGSHDELVADETGKYFELWNAQAQYYTA